MKRSSLHAFTLVEMLTVMAVIAILTSLIVGTAGYVQNKSAKTKALGEITEMAQGCDRYKQDYGSYPQDDDTDLLDARLDGNPVSGESGKRYEKANLDLYRALSGDTDKNPDYKAEEGEKSYIWFKPSRLNYEKDQNGQPKEVKYIMDPFGNCYGYSTIGLQTEAEYIKQLKKDPATPRPQQQKGYNNATFDMWSTAGQTGINSDEKWVKNWGS